MTLDEVRDFKLTLALAPSPSPNPKPSPSSNPNPTHHPNEDCAELRKLSRVYEIIAAGLPEVRLRRGEG